MRYVTSMLEELLKEKAQIIEQIKNIPLEDIYEEKQAEMQRLDKIHEEIQNIKRETHGI